MRWIAVLAVFIGTMIAVAAGSFATTLTISFSASITSSSLAGYAVGDPISGSMTLNLNPTPVDHSGIRSFFGSGSADWGSGNLTASAAVEDTAIIGRQFDFEVYDNSLGNSLGLEFTGTNASSPLLQSLDDVPTNIAEAEAFVGGSTINGLLGINYHVAHFTLTSLSVAQTPIPAALPLFISALGGLGFFGWRRRQSAA